MTGHDCIHFMSLLLTCHPQHNLLVYHECIPNINDILYHRMYLTALLLSIQLEDELLKVPFLFKPVTPDPRTRRAYGRFS